MRRNDKGSEGRKRGREILKIERKGKVITGGEEK